MANCINCNEEVSTAYCPACGQRNPVNKINMANMWSDFVSRTYGFDGMFPRTLKDLTIRPGQVAREYIKGNRVKYYGPLGYFFLTLTVYLLIASMLDVDLVAFMVESSPSDPKLQNNAGQELAMEYISLTTEYMRLFSFLVALSTVFFTWLVFRKSKYNFIETGTLVFFVTGHVMWISIGLTVVYKITGYVPNSFYLLLISVVFMIYSYVNFYKHTSKWKVALRGIFVYFLNYFAFLIFLACTVFYRASTDKDFYKKIKPSNNKPKVEQSPSVK